MRDIDYQTNEEIIPLNNTDIFIIRQNAWQRGMLFGTVMTMITVIIISLFLK